MSRKKDKQMPAPIDQTRCTGNQCPSATNCRRYTERATGIGHIKYAAYWARREAGADACESIEPVRKISYFKEQA